MLPRDLCYTLTVVDGLESSFRPIAIHHMIGRELLRDEPGFHRLVALAAGRPQDHATATQQENGEQSRREKDPDFDLKSDGHGRMSCHIRRPLPWWPRRTTPSAGVRRATRAGSSMYTPR
jgi:hypothetical protein